MVTQAVEGVLASLDPRSCLACESTAKYANLTPEGQYISKPPLRYNFVPSLKHSYVLPHCVQVTLQILC